MRHTVFVLGTLAAASLACGPPDISDDSVDPGLSRTEPAQVTPRPLVVPPPTTGAIRDLYVALRDRGCDVETIDSPVVTRVLRNTPFALAGRRFQTPELAALYTADGWYAPTADTVTLGESDAACVAKLKAHEDRLRRSECLEPAAEAALLSAQGVFLWHARVGLSGLYGEPRDPKAPTGIPADPGVDLCAGEGVRPRREGMFSVRHYSVQVGSLTDADAIRQHVNIEIEGFDHIVSPGTTAALATEPEQWLGSHGGARTLEVEVHGTDFDSGPEWAEQYDFMIVRHCAGPGAYMSRDWLCAGYSLP